MRIKAKGCSCSNPSHPAPSCKRAMRPLGREPACKHKQRAAVSVPRASGWFGSAWGSLIRGRGNAVQQQTDALEAILELVKGTQYGHTIGREAAQEVAELVSTLGPEPAGGPEPQRPGAAAAAGAARSYQQLDGRWRLLYTTERSVHQIVGAAALLGLPVGSIAQTIDMSGDSRVTNRIELSRLGVAIEAGGPAEVAGQRRIAYAFDGVFVEALGARWRLPVAPRGGGWTEAACVTSEHRVMRNSLGDTLVFARADAH